MHSVDGPDTNPAETPSGGPVFRSFRPLALALTALLTIAGEAAAARRKAPKPEPAKPETVYVSVPAPAPARPAAPARSEAPSRRRESADAASLRDYAQAFGGYAGFYVADVLGSNPYGAAFWEFYPARMPIFFQFDCGVGTVQSGFSRDIVGGTNFDHNFMLALDALGGYSLSGLDAGRGRGGGLFPYFLAGITAFWQGGLPIVQESVPNIGAVIGFGNRLRLPFFGSRRDWAFNYVIRDNIYSQKLNNKPSITQNFALLVGVQKYW